MVDKRMLKVVDCIGEIAENSPVDLSEENVNIEKAGSMVYNTMCALEKLRGVELKEEEIDELAGVFSALGFVEYKNVSKKLYKAGDVTLNGVKENVFNFPLSVYVHLIADDAKSVSEYLRTINEADKHGDSWCSKWCKEYTKYYWKEFLGISLDM